MLIATYNVNSINARLENLLVWLSTAKPDVVLVHEHFAGSRFLSMTVNLRFSSTTRMIVLSSSGNAFSFASSSMR